MWIAVEGKEGRTGETPRGDDLDVWFETIEGELETDLVVSFTSAAMRNIAADRIVRKRMTEGSYCLLASFTLSDSNHTTGNDWAGKRRAE